MIGMHNDLGEVMRAMSRAMGQAADGKMLKRELSKRLRSFMGPLVAEQRARVLRLPSKGHSGASMRQTIARQTRAATRWSGQNAGIQIVQRARGMPRGFNMAGRAFNREQGWNPQTLGGDTVHQDIRPAEWFDEPVKDARPEMTRQVIGAIEETAAKIARSARG